MLYNYNVSKTCVQLIASGFNVFKETLLTDFPAEIFLQRPIIINVRDSDDSDVNDEADDAMLMKTLISSFSSYLWNLRNRINCSHLRNC